MNEKTFFGFDGNRIRISSDLIPIIIFIQEIEGEVENFLGFDKKLKLIEKQYKEIIGLMLELAKKIKENSINFNYTLSENPLTFIKNLSLGHSTRSETIILFAYLEVLLCLNIAYENKISEKNILQKATDEKTVLSFYNNFCLSKENEWGKKNQERLKRLNAKELRNLRNSLTHFFSVDKQISLSSHTELNIKSNKIEKDLHFKTKFISPEDLYEMTKGTAILMIKKWDTDCKECSDKNSYEFKEKISSVLNIVEKYGTIVIKEEEINI